VREHMAKFFDKLKIDKLIDNLSWGFAHDHASLQFVCFIREFLMCEGSGNAQG